MDRLANPEDRWSSQSSSEEDFYPEAPDRAPIADWDVFADPDPPPEPDPDDFYHL